ncbi:hypothetical protein GYMLUDRAFT_240585 [Collybiopsis luxurians FD-317 M1]|nr:hypothetical protein GYMLUDRAFT_240585 [Collybiopsis luxurians FD-317 M1]
MHAVYIAFNPHASRFQLRHHHYPYPANMCFFQVFALYNQSILVGTFLVILIVVGFAGPTVVLGWAFAQAKIEFSGFCSQKISLTPQSRYSSLIFTCGVLAIHLVLHGLAWKRTIWDFRLITLFRPTMISVLNRDGLKMFAGTLGITLFLIASLVQPLMVIPVLVATIAIVVAVFKRGVAIVFIFPLLITCVSVSGTRTILNLQALSDEAGSSPKSRNQVELTGIEDLTAWEAPWDTSTSRNE